MAPWFDATGTDVTHTNTDPANAAVCALCHTHGRNLRIPILTHYATGTPGCFNSTLCHGNVSPPRLSLSRFGPQSGCGSSLYRLPGLSYRQRWGISRSGQHAARLPGMPQKGEPRRQWLRILSWTPCRRWSPQRHRLPGRCRRSIMRVIILYLLAPTVTGTLLVPDSRLMARATEPHTMTSTL